MALEEFIVTTDFTELKQRVFYGDELPARSKLEKIETKYGTVIAFQNTYTKEPHKTTVAVGYFRKDLPPSPEGLERMQIETIPESQQQEISKILRQQGYEGNVNFWEDC